MKCKKLAWLMMFAILCFEKERVIPMLLPADNRPLRERFLNPPADARILKIVHSLPDSPDQQDALFERLLSQGFGGVVCNVSFENYLQSEEKWQSFLRGVKKAKELNMALWLYDERGYPSGTAGGLTLKDHPEWEARGLLFVEVMKRGGEVVELALPPGKLIGVWAFPLTSKGIDLKGKVDLGEYVKEDELRWRVPEGEWQIMLVSESRLYHNTHAAISLADKLPYINLLMPEPTKRFIELTHEQYAKHLGEDLSRYFIATFTDEPSLMSRFFLPTTYRPVPWAPNLPEEFKKRRGYDLLPYLPLLVAEGENAPKVRYDFWQTVGELVAEGFFRQIRDWCRKHGIASGGHLLLEENLTDHVALYGNFFLCVKYLDAPSIDCLTSVPSEVPWRIARLIGSARDLNRSSYTMCETSDFVQVYRPQGDNRPIRVVTEDEIRGTCNRLIHGGINTITSYYTFTNLSDEQLRRLNEWVGRCCTMLRGGHQVADIALLYPIESMWVHFRPATQGATDSPTAQRIESIFNQASDALYNANRDFLYVDSPTLLSASLQGDSLVYEGMKWRVIVLPGVDTLSLEVWRKLYRFWQEGGVIVSLGALPQNSEKEFPSPEVEGMASQLFGKGEGLSIKKNKKGGVAVFIPRNAVALLPAVLDRIIEQDVKVREPRSPIRITHRRIDNRDVYFLINDSGEPYKVGVSFRGKEGEVWDPKDGSVKPLPKERWVELEFGPYDGLFVCFPAVELPKRLTPSGEDLFKGESPTPSEVRISSGEFVEGDLSRTDDMWQTKGKLKKGEVDCFLFLSFLYSQPLNLRDVDCLSFRIFLPKGQGSPARLFAILRDGEGVDFLADTGLTISEGSTGDVLIPLGAFHAVPWGKGENLNWGNIVAISIGWGGYYGKEGEELRFSARPPALLRLR